MHLELDKKDGEGVRNFCQTLMSLTKDHDMQLGTQDLCKLAEKGLLVQHYLDLSKDDARKQLEEAHKRISELELKDSLVGLNLHEKRLAELEPAIVSINKLVDLYAASQLVSRANLVLKIQKVRDIVRPLQLPTQLKRGQRVETKERRF